jgi:ribonuclease HII
MHIIGMDEAGRGCLAGSIFGASVLIEDVSTIPEEFLVKIKDSKKTSKEHRAEIFKELSLNYLDNIHYQVWEISAEDIDKHNIGWANKEIFHRSFEILKDKYTHLEVEGIADGNLNLQNGIKSIIKADDFILEVSLASIIAKYFKDVEMENYHLLYPDFNFIKHSGYGTKKHIEAINKYGGIEKIHRFSFKKVIRKEN